MDETETIETPVPTEAPAAFEAEPFEASPLVEEAVAEAVEEIVSKVESGEAAAVPTRRKSDRRPAPRGGKSKINLEDTVDSLADTVNSLADSIAVMASTVEVLSEKVTTPVVIEAPAPVQLPDAVDEPVVAEDQGALDEKKYELDASMRRGTIDFFATTASYFGVGMVAYASMRHHVSLLALLVGVLGAVVFVAGTVFDRRAGDLEGLKPRLRTAGSALLMAVGLGFAIGGAFFFGNAPHRADKLIPLGLALFTAGFFVRGRYVVARHHLVWVTGIGVWVCLFASLGLGHIANSVDPKAPTPVAPAASTTDTTAVDSAAPATDETTTTQDTSTTDAPATDETTTTEVTTTDTAAPAADPGITPQDAATIGQAMQAAQAATPQ